MSATFHPDLDAFFARIGYAGPRTPTLQTLRAVQGRMVRSIPFENLDVLRGRPIGIDPAGLERKLVHERRGGYCFELNTYFAAVLRELGFRVTPLGARVRWNVPADAATPKTHLLLLVELDRRYIADVGFGSMSLDGPLELDTEDEQPAPLEPRRIVRRDGDYLQQARLGTAWADVYRFSLAEFLPVDAEMANWFTSTWPGSRFRQCLTVSRADDGRRSTILNREFTVRHADGRTEKSVISSPEELLALLAEHFGLVFPAGTRFEAPAAPWPA